MKNKLEFNALAREMQNAECKMGAQSAPYVILSEPQASRRILAPIILQMKVIVQRFFDSVLRTPLRMTCFWCVATVRQTEI